MNDKKNIDRLFQEKFKDFEVTPPDFVWENLQSRLEEKKKRRVIPLWFKFSGVAAILVAGIFVLAPYLNNNDGNNNSIVIDVQEKNPDGTNRINPTPDPVRPNQSVSETGVASEESSNGNANNGNVRGNNSNNNDVAAPYQNKDNEVAGTEKNKPVNPQRQKTPELRFLQKRDGGNAVASSGNVKEVKSSNSTGIHKKDKTRSAVINPETAVAQNIREDKNKNIITGQNVAGQTEKKTDAVQPAAVNNFNNVIPQEGLAANADGEGNKANENSSNNTFTVLPKNNTENAIAESAVDTASVIKPENELEKMLREKLNGEDVNEKAVAEVHERGKWNIKPQMAPLFFNTASQGSPIDSNLAANSKDFDNDLSYGVGLNYALTDKISIRSGINTVNMRYSTNDIAAYATLDPQPANSLVAPSGTNATIAFGTADASASPESSSLRTEPITGSVVQKIGFIEVPLELSYKLVNRKFGIDIIGGVSTMFLNDNNVSLVSDQGYSSNMGEANNINNISFSTNVGVGFKYTIIESLEASFEPMFKYQLNTFSNNSGNFRPYFIGLYSGVSFSF